MNIEEYMFSQKQRIDKLLFESEGVFTDEINKIIEELELDSKSKILLLVEKYDEQISLIKTREEKLEIITKKIATATNSAEWWRTKIDGLMKINKFTELHLDEYHLKYKKLPAKVEITNDALVPDEYKTTKTTESTTTSKTKIKEAILAKKSVPEQNYY